MYLLAQLGSVGLGPAAQRCMSSSAVRRLWFAALKVQARLLVPYKVATETMLFSLRFEIP
jgi:hypothetical protein